MTYTRIVDPTYFGTVHVVVHSKRIATWPGIAVNLLCAALICFVNSTLVPPLYGVGFAAVGMAFFAWLRWLKHPPYSLILFAFLYTVSFPLKLVTVALTGIQFTFVGGFDYSPEQYQRALFLTVGAIVGALAGYDISRLCFRLVKLKLRKPSASSAQKVSAVGVLLGFFLISIALHLAMAQLGVGSTGLRAVESLPGRLAGILLYSRIVVLPYVGLWVANWAIDARRVRVFVLALFLISIEGTIGALLAVSKGVFIVQVLPVVLLVTTSPTVIGKIKKAARAFLAIAAVVTTFLIPVIVSQRDVLYTSANPNLSTRFVAIQDGVATALSANWVPVIHQAATRIMGVDTVMAAVAYEGASATALLRSIFDPVDFNYSLTVLRYNMPLGENIAFGSAPGFFGTMALSGSIPLTTIYTAFFTALVLGLEGLYSQLSIICRTRALVVSGSFFVVWYIWEFDLRSLFFGAPLLAITALLLRRMRLK